jgi:(p)ppGpp synthase/HD superfamily hydrolase
MKNIQAYPPIGRAHFLSRLNTGPGSTEYQQVEWAYKLAKGGHRGRTRIGGSPRFFEHPKAVAWILIDELDVRDHRLVVLALIHDLIEDEFIVDLDLIEVVFGAYVRYGLDLLSNRPGEHGVDRMVEAGDPYVMLVKLADNLQNLRSLDGCDARTRRKQTKRSQQNILPMADLVTTLLPEEERWRAEWFRQEIDELIQHHQRRLASEGGGHGHQADKHTRPLPEVGGVGAGVGNAA